MAKKIALNLYVDPDMAARLRESAAHYDNRLGDCLSAAIFLFLSATPQEQAEALQEVYAAALTNSVKSLLDEMRAEQVRRSLATADDLAPASSQRRASTGKQNRGMDRDG
jgi:DNA-binding SARP family transcriptional activator